MAYTTKTRRTARRLAVLAGLTFILAGSAEAGPPLLCQPFDPGPGAALLPWDGAARGWDGTLASYDRSRLIRDTLDLLAEDAPILARMENLRRATLYAARDRRLAGDLRDAVLARTRVPGQAVRARALALFDAGVLLEAYAQANQVFEWDMLNADTQRAWVFDADQAEDGYELVRQALALAGSNPGMEYAASLMTAGPAER